VSEPYFVFYQIAMLLSLLAASFLSVLLWRRRQAPGARAIIALTAATMVWTLGFYLEANSATLQQQLFFNNIGYLGSMSVPVAWFVFSLHYTGSNWRLTRRKILLLCIVPLVTVVLIWTNGWHHIMWFNEHLGSSGPFTVTIKTYGPFFWISLAYNYFLIIAGAIILVRRLFVGTTLYTMQAVSLIIAISIPLIWNIIYVFNLVPLPRKDLTPVMFTISSTAITFGLMRFHLLLAVPFARKFLIQQLNDGILVFDMYHRLLEANPAALKILGVDSNIIGKRLDASLLSPFQGRLPPIISGSLELPLTVAGEGCFYELETAPMRDSQGQQVGWLAILHDITEKKKIREQLVAQDRLASIGKLTSGVAHELNNPLATIVGFSELLLKRNLQSEVQTDLNIIFREAERAARIVDNLLTFARQKSEDKMLCDINGIIRKTLELRTYEQGENNIRTLTRFNPELPPISGNDIQLQQVFLNLITNAEFFMIRAHGKGSLTIITERIADLVRISVIDDGPGISRENMKYLFTPFFTTKEIGKGTGLGLSICHGIITEHGGRIWAESIAGKGATFILELPVSHQPPEESVKEIH
jgi:PAS domain S-box-containing protein